MWMTWWLFALKQGLESNQKKNWLLSYTLRSSARHAATRRRRSRTPRTRCWRPWRSWPGVWDGTRARSAWRPRRWADTGSGRARPTSTHRRKVAPPPSKWAHYSTLLLVTLLVHIPYMHAYITQCWEMTIVDSAGTNEEQSFASFLCISTFLPD